MSRPRYLAQPLHYESRRVGWCVSEVGSVRMAVGYTGPFAWWRARFRTASLNRKGRQPLVGSIPAHGKWRQAQ